MNYSEYSDSKLAIWDEISYQQLEDSDYVVLYSGSLDYSDGSTVTTEDTEGMDTIVPFYMYKTSQDIQDFDKDKPTFKWFQDPAEGQMTVNLLLDTLDQTRTDDTLDITPPRGLSSINKLSLSEASYITESGEIVGSIHASFYTPDFSFLPLDKEATGTSGYIDYTNTSYVSVYIEGDFAFNEDNAFKVYFNKYADSNSYVINLMGAEDSVLTFEDIKEYIFSTLAADTEVS